MPSHKPEETLGFLDYEGQTYRATVARCWLWKGHLTIKASGPNWDLQIVGVPFPDVQHYTDLPGCKWNPSDDELAEHADTFAEGNLSFGDDFISMNAGTISCVSFKSASNRLALELTLFGESEFVTSVEVTGLLSCDALTTDPFERSWG